MLRQILVICALLTTSLISVNAQDKAVYTHQKLSDTFYVLTGPSANVGLVIAPEGLLLIDPGARGGNQIHLETAIKEISIKPVKYVVTTHHHMDHSGANTFFASKGATIISNDTIRYLDKNNARYKATYNQILLSSKLALKFGSETVNIYPVASHTGDDTIVHLANNNAVFTGDNHATNWGPNLGFGGLRGQNAVIDLASDLSNEKTRVVPGHGYITDKTHLTDYKKRTTEWVTFVLSLHKQGLSADQIAVDATSLDMLAAFANGNKSAGLMRKDRLTVRVQFVIDSTAAVATEDAAINLHAYTGTYSIDADTAIELKIIEGRLFAMEEGEYMVQLIPQSPQQFAYAQYGGKGGTYDFTLDRNGAPQSVSYVYDSKTTTGHRQ